MQKLFFLLFLVFSLGSCKNDAPKPEQSPTTSEIQDITYAKGFSIEQFENYQVISLTNPWPDAKETFKYCLVKKGETAPVGENFSAVIETPINSIVVTSTTHIPSLEMLGVEESLVGFPNRNYISSEKTRALIDDDKVKELGKNEAINTEVLIDLAPDVMVTFAIEGVNKTVKTIQNTGIPVLYNSDWTETHPLGKAEWIKFFGALYGKQNEANRIFSEIEQNYKSAQTLAASAIEKPTVLSGAMYKDVWYLPQGDSWAAQFIRDANGTYLWSDSEGTGSLSLSLESVLEKGQKAAIWLGPGQFKSKEGLQEAHSVYTQFEAYQNDNIYSFTAKKGATGGVLYYELAPNRPDIVLKDIIKILHPDLLTEHELYFFSKVE